MTYPKERVPWGKVFGNISKRVNDWFSFGKKAKNLNIDAVDLQKVAEELNTSPKQAEDFINSKGNGFKPPKKNDKNGWKKLRNEFDEWDFFNRNPNIRNKLTTPREKSKFYNEFKDAQPNELNKLNNKPELVDVWKTCSDAVKVSRKNPVFLEKLNHIQKDYENYKNAIDNSTRMRTLYHHLKGFYAGSKGSPVGGHLYLEAIQQIEDLEGNLHTFVKITHKNTDQVVPLQNFAVRNERIKIDFDKYDMYIAQYIDVNRQPYKFKRYRQKRATDVNTLFPYNWTYEEIME